ncbi:MAG: hypothetical protein WAT62_02780 [Candidatus Nanogingivalis sp.]
MQKIVKSIKKNRIFFVVSLIALIFSLMTNTSFILWTLSVYLLSKLIRIPKNINILSIRLLLSFMILMAVYQIIALILFVFKFEISSLVYNILVFLPLQLIYIFKPNLSEDVKFNTKEDLKIVAAPIVILIISICGLFFVSINNNINLDVAIIKTISYGGDNIHNMAIFSDMVNSNPTILDPTIESNNSYQIQSEGASYPSGWHLSSSIITGSFGDLSNSEYINTVRAYYIIRLLNLFVGVMALSSFLYALLNKYRKKSSIIKVVAYSLAISVITFLNYQSLGFFSFTPTVTYVILASLLIFSIKTEKDIYNSSYIIGLLSVGIMTTWMLPVPIFAASIGLIMLIYSKDYKRIIKQILFWLSIIAVCFIQYKITSANVDINHASVYGYIITPDIRVILGMAIITGCGLFINNKTQSRYLVVLLTTAIIYLLSVYLYFFIKDGEVAYYVIKLSLVFFNILLPISAVFFDLIFFEKMHFKINKVVFGLILSAIIINFMIPQEMYKPSIKSIFKPTDIFTRDAKLISEQFSKNKYNIVNDDRIQYIFLYKEERVKLTTASRLSVIDALKLYNYKKCSGTGGIVTINKDQLDGILENCNNIYKKMVIIADEYYLNLIDKNKFTVQSVELGNV